MLINSLIELFTTYWWVILTFFVVATLYSSVGFGGGSSYLAILALTSLAMVEIRSIALFSNVIVVTSGFYIFAKSGHVNWKKIIPLVIFSVPFAYIGGSMKISEKSFFILLGITLFAAGILMILSSRKEIATDKFYKKNYLRDGFLGGSIGFLAGMVGIGGGIFLAPLLHLIKWDTSKKIAATASFFILVNSIAGLFGQISNPDFTFNFEITAVLLFTVFLGGQIGSRIGARVVSQLFLKRATAILIIYVSLMLLKKHLIG